MWKWSNLLYNANDLHNMLVCLLISHNKSREDQTKRLASHKDGSWGKLPIMFLLLFFTIIFCSNVCTNIPIPQASDYPTKVFFLCLALYDIMTVDIPNMVISHWPHLLASTKLLCFVCKGQWRRIWGNLAKTSCFTQRMTWRASPRPSIR